eukprot:256340-Chlamydomonas_euryale.AAC.1
MPGQGRAREMVGRASLPLTNHVCCMLEDHGTTRMSGDAHSAKGAAPEQGRELLIVCQLPSSKHPQLSYLMKMGLYVRTCLSVNLDLSIVWNK